MSSTSIADWFIDGNEAMSRVDKAGIYNTCRAVVPVRAVEALVADTKYVLVTAIANCMVACIAAWLKKSLGERIQGHVLHSSSKGMLWVVAMLEAYVTWNTKIKVITHSAGDKAFFGEFCKTWLAWCFEREIVRCKTTYLECTSCKFW